MSRLVLVLVLTLPATLQAQEEPPPLPPEEAARQVSRECTVQMLVRSSGKAANGEVMFLNSEADYRSDKNFTIMIGRRALTLYRARKIEDPATYFKDRTIRVTGTVKLYRGRPEMIVNDPSQVLIVEK